MRKYWGIISNGVRLAGCSGASIYVYDQNGRELARFHDLPYAYAGAFQPGTNIFVAKSTGGMLAAYDLDKLALIRKFGVNSGGCEDEGFAFSTDGAYFLNIAKPCSSCRTQLDVYRTEDFSLVHTCFAENEDVMLQALEFSESVCYVCGYIRSTQGTFGYGFVGRVTSGGELSLKPLAKSEYETLVWSKAWENHGFSERYYEWNSQYYTLTHVSLAQTWAEK